MFCPEAPLWVNPALLIIHFLVYSACCLCVVFTFLIAAIVHWNIDIPNRFLYFISILVVQTQIQYGSWAECVKPIKAAAKRSTDPTCNSHKVVDTNIFSLSTGCIDRTSYVT